MNNISALELKLYDALITVSDDDDFIIGAMTNVDHDDDFIIGAMTNVEHDDDRKSLIKFIESGENVTYSNVLLESVILDQKRRGLIK